MRRLATLALAASIATGCTQLDNPLQPTPKTRLTEAIEYWHEHEGWTQPLEQRLEPVKSIAYQRPMEAELRRTAQQLYGLDEFSQAAYLFEWLLKERYQAADRTERIQSLEHSLAQAQSENRRLRNRQPQIRTRTITDTTYIPTTCSTDWPTPDATLGVRSGEHYLVFPKATLVCQEQPERVCLRLEDVLAHPQNPGAQLTVEIKGETPTYR